jgi:hypothetical protein
MAQTRIRADFDTLKANYPTYKRLPSQIQKYMDELNKDTPGKNTPCCIQVSHALNKAGMLVPKAGYRRNNAKIGDYFYVLAVDELEQYLTWRYGQGEEIKVDPATKKVRTTKEMKEFLKGRQGILLFRNGGAGHHTELWDDTHIMQDGKAVSGGGAIMNESNIFGQPRVLFWDVKADADDTPAAPVPDWLQGWWKVYDGETYYYYFSDQWVVTYTKTAPKNILVPPVKTPLNEGDVTIAENSAKIVLDWNPADGGETVETFTRQPTSTDFMNGVSNRYAPLVANKMK